MSYLSEDITDGNKAKYLCEFYLSIGHEIVGLSYKIGKADQGRHLLY